MSTPVGITVNFVSAELLGEKIDIALRDREHVIRLAQVSLLGLRHGSPLAPRK
jgi:hypothetical protein